MFVKEATGDYRAAERAEILAEAARLLQERFERQPLTAPQHVRQYLAAKLDRREEEVFVVLFLDMQHRLIAYEELFTGTIDGTAVYPRIVVKRTLEHNAAAIIVAHSHPSGSAEPSRADELLTNRLKEALALIDVRLLDHIVVGAGETTSFAERGLI